jgi:hypothetical protein
MAFRYEYSADCDALLIVVVVFRLAGVNVRYLQPLSWKVACQVSQDNPVGSRGVCYRLQISLTMDLQDLDQA